jgi:hypothetical protein
MPRHGCNAATEASLRAHARYVEEQVLAVAFAFGGAPAGCFAADGKVGSGAGAAVAIGVKKR